MNCPDGWQIIAKVEKISWKRGLRAMLACLGGRISARPVTACAAGSRRRRRAKIGMAGSSARKLAARWAVVLRVSLARPERAATSDSAQAQLRIAASPCGVGRHG